MHVVRVARRLQVERRPTLGINDVLKVTEMAPGMQANPPTIAERGNPTTTLVWDQIAADEQRVDMMERRLQQERDRGVQTQGNMDR